MMAETRGAKKDNREIFEAAKLIYEVLLSEEGRFPGFQKVADKLRQLIRGLPKEDEFMVVSKWLGRCRLIHKLDQEYQSSSSEEWRIPDLLAIYNYNDKDMPVLIEVKATDKAKLKDFPNIELRFTARYYRDLLGYSRHLGLPLLVAWRCLGFWVLFDIEVMDRKKRAHSIDLETAMQHDLMGCLVGNFGIAFQTGIRFVLVFEKVRLMKEEANGSKVSRTWQLIVRDAKWLDPSGRPVDTSLESARALWFLWLFTDMEEETTEEGNTITISFCNCLNDEGLHAYSVPSMALSLSREAEHEHIKWSRALKRGFWAPTSKTLHDAIDWGLKAGLVRYGMHFVPHVLPSFLADKNVSIPNRMR